MEQQFPQKILHRNIRKFLTENLGFVRLSPRISTDLVGRFAFRKFNIRKFRTIVSDSKIVWNFLLKGIQKRLNAGELLCAHCVCLFLKNKSYLQLVLVH